ncbi:MAG TPA: rhodanese-like domain-containing protein [Candidatus Kapabacteria bacterium]|nr:rhodanese-like domain-containing protein [Candidatus Kapabacteria bacterium]
MTFIVACSSVQKTSNNKYIDQQTGLIIIDVRSNEEWNEGHLENAIHIPVDDIKSQIVNNIPNKDASIAVYCQTGYRANIAKTSLEALGYTHVSNLGGYEEASQALGKKIIISR